MKYKVGDRVKVRSDLKSGKLYGNIAFVSDMNSFLGSYVTICKIDSTTFRVPVYRIEESNHSFVDEMLEDEEYNYPIYSFLTEIAKKMKIENLKYFKIKSYKVCDNDGVKTVVVTFANGVKTHAVCNKDDVFELSRGIEVCVLKYMFGDDKYKEIVREANNQIKAIDRAAEKAKKDAEKEKAEIESKKRKAAKRKAKRIAKKRANRVAEMKEAYLAAMREYEKEDCAACESFLDDIK